MTKAKFLALQLILEDTRCFRGLFEDGFVSLKDSSVIMLGLMPYLSAYVVDSFEYLRRENSKFEKLLLQNHQKIIRISRLRMKLTGGRAEKLGDLVKFLEGIDKSHYDQFQRMNQSFLRSFLSRFQADLGQYKFDNYLIGTTHTAYLHLGYVNPDDEIFINQGKKHRNFEVGRELGTYIKVLDDSVFRTKANGKNGQISYQLEDGILSQEYNVKSQIFYPNVFNSENSIGLNRLLVWLLCVTNFAYFILPNIFSHCPTSLFKMRYLTLYHVVMSLHKIQNYYYPRNVLAERSKDILKDLLGESFGKKIKAQTSFRNVLVHYSVNDISEKNIRMQLPLYGLAEHFFKGATFEEINVKLDKRLEFFSIRMNEWMNK